jgi:hypothetical protein
MQAPPVVVHSPPFPPETLGAPGLAFETWEFMELAGAPGLAFETWESNGRATSRTGIIAFRPTSGSSTGVTVE